MKRFSITRLPNGKFGVLDSLINGLQLVAAGMTEGQAAAEMATREQRHNPTYIPPADFVAVPTDHPLETGKWLTPGGWYHVELADQSQATWDRYCAETAENNRTKIRARSRRESELLAALVSAEWGDA